MSDRLVDLLEAVEVEDENRIGEVLAPGLAQGLVQPVAKQMAVRTVGQGVDQSDVLGRTPFQIQRAEFVADFLESPQQFLTDLGCPPQADDGARRAIRDVANAAQRLVRLKRRCDFWFSRVRSFARHGATESRAQDKLWPS